MYLTRLEEMTTAILTGFVVPVNEVNVLYGFKEITTVSLTSGFPFELSRE